MDYFSMFNGQRAFLLRTAASIYNIPWYNRVDMLMAKMPGRCSCSSSRIWADHTTALRSSNAPDSQEVLAAAIQSHQTIRRSYISQDGLLSSGL
jgi:hypothetical protein